MQYLTLVLVIVVGAVIVGGTVIYFLRARFREAAQAVPSNLASAAAPVAVAEEVKAIGTQIEQAMTEQRMQGETQRQLLAQKLDSVRQSVESQRTHVDGLRSELRHESKRRDLEMNEIRTQIGTLQTAVALPPADRLALPASAPEAGAPAPDAPGPDRAVPEGAAAGAPAPRGSASPEPTAGWTYAEPEEPTGAGFEPATQPETDVFQFVSFDTATDGLASPPASRASAPAPVSHTPAPAPVPALSFVAEAEPADAPAERPSEVTSEPPAAEPAASGSAETSTLVFSSAEDPDADPVDPFGEISFGDSTASRDSFPPTAGSLSAASSDSRTWVAGPTTDAPSTSGSLSADSIFEDPFATDSFGTDSFAADPFAEEFEDTEPASASTPAFEDASADGETAPLVTADFTFADVPADAEAPAPSESLVPSESSVPEASQDPARASEPTLASDPAADSLADAVSAPDLPAAPPSTPDVEPAWIARSDRPETSDYDLPQTASASDFVSFPPASLDTGLGAALPGVSVTPSGLIDLDAFATPTPSSEPEPEAARPPSAEAAPPSPSVAEAGMLGADMPTPEPPTSVSQAPDASTFTTPEGADDLTVITSIDADVQRRLYMEGVTTLEEIAEWGRARARRVSEVVQVSEDIIMNQWVFEAQAAMFEQFSGQG